MPRGQTSERQAPAGQPSGERNEERVREQSIEYWRCRRRCSWALGVIAASIVVLTIFHTPAAWGDGRIAYALRTVAWVALVVAALVAYRNNGRVRGRRLLPRPLPSERERVDVTRCGSRLRPCRTKERASPRARGWPVPRWGESRPS